MINKYYNKLTIEKKQCAIHRIAAMIDIPEYIVKKNLENHNPLMDIRKNRVVINRNSYDRLLKDIRKEYSGYQ